MKNCPICLERELGTKKSHIIPKMFRNELGGEKSKIKIKKIQPSKEIKEQDKKTYQDIPKETGLLCDECEHNLSILEGYYASRIYSIFQSNNYNENFRIKKGIRNRWYEIDNINMKLVCLFYQSILLRQHLSSLEAFIECNLTDELAERIRRQLDFIMSDNPTQMHKNLREYKEDDYLFMPFINWTVKKKKQDDNFLGGIPNQTGNYLLMLNNVRVVITEDLKSIKRYKSSYSTSDSSTFKIDIKSEKDWLKDSKRIVMEIDSYLNSI